MEENLVSRFILTFIAINDLFPTKTSLSHPDISISATYLTPLLHPTYHLSDQPKAKSSHPLPPCSLYGHSPPLDSSPLTYFVSITVASRPVPTNPHATQDTQPLHLPPQSSPTPTPGLIPALSPTKHSLRTNMDPTTAPFQTNPESYTTQVFSSTNQTSNTHPTAAPTKAGLSNVKPSHTRA